MSGTDNPYDRMPRIKDPDGHKVVCAPGNLAAAVALAQWREAGEPGDFFEWLAEQEDR